MDEPDRYSSRPSSGRFDNVSLAPVVEAFISSDPIDFPALAALQRGEAKDVLAPTPHQEGMVVSIARIDDQNATTEAIAETTTAA